MPQYELVLEYSDGERLLLDACGMNPFPIICREGAKGTNNITLTLTEEEFVFLSLKYKIIRSHEFTAVDVVGSLINA